LAAAGSGKALLIVLAVINGFLFATIFWRDRSNKLALYLLLFSVVSVVSVLPEAVGQVVRVDYRNGNWLAIGAAMYALLCVAVSRRAGLTVAGSIIAGLIPFLLPNLVLQPMHWAIQCALVFFLLHSLRWRDTDRLEVSLARAIVAVGWVAHSQVWACAGGSWVALTTIGLVVLSIYCLARLLTGEWASWTIPAASLLVMLSVPLKFGTVKLASLPSGMLAILASFLLFALGTALALTKHRWHTETVPDNGNESELS
jgi:hypothetical protein